MLLDVLTIVPIRARVITPFSGVTYIVQSSGYISQELFRHNNCDALELSYEI
jgi:hypothetical protein